VVAGLFVVCVGTGLCVVGVGSLVVLVKFSQTVLTSPRGENFQKLLVFDE